jgi:hypothetical protein
MWPEEHCAYGVSLAMVGAQNEAEVINTGEGRLSEATLPHGV